MKKALISLGSALLVVGIAVVYSYLRLSYKPDWYTQSGADSKSLAAADDEAPDRDEMQRIERSLKEIGEAAIANDKVAQMMTHQAVKRVGLDVRSMIKAIKCSTSIEQVVVEVVVDVTKIPREKLPPRARRALDKMLELVRGTALRELYIKVILTRPEQGGPIRPHPKSKVCVGKMEFTVGELEKKVGLSSESVLRKMGWSNLELTQEGIVLRD